MSADDRASFLKCSVNNYYVQYLYLKFSKLKFSTSINLEPMKPSFCIRKSQVDLTGREKYKYS